MTFTSEEEKDQVRKAFNVFLVANGYNLTKFCTAFELDYFETWQRINRGNIDGEFINELAAKIDTKSKLQNVNKSWVIWKN